jgi:hypothetical protein
MIKNRFLSLLTVFLIVTGCATSVTQDISVDADADPKANFSAYKSYAWLGSATIVYDAEGKWEPPAFDADAEIKFLIDRELRKRGMVEDSLNPDMIVIFAAGVDMDVQQYTVDPESKIEVLENVPLGALSVVLVDADTELVIWAGLATAEIQEEPTSEVVKQRLNYAVTTMFKKLPR